ncbi:bifunctional 4-hydroxy-2-oxoglutarate aldolase/2-dehydro-3-deoxy-phosphogluconate aldolase [uncultured Pseudokineococcus sp.]|uniref:bifunctional 4-hydroxy-2-oxoglutarate aldolase/2-dehydro-3-deoxy-phosphogluconate aldolase n=1 Tax=uncultured Pseudokineococcus sp. TaxID=1642928 RepID=UPI002634D0A6|nr:bifunctional 4-hydroxy-2-oxoglutarate aldolase/2-dehydro-3-deoxy-phosphogluconate aldolase [uncultured Pseudokineococcus sp.]
MSVPGADGPGAAELLAVAPVIPVLVLDDATTAVPVARALVAGGLPVLEVTLRTDAALAALERVAAEVPGAVVGAGTVRTGAQAREAVRAGARFLVSPGSHASLVRSMQETGAAVLPGVATPTEVLAVQDLGLSEMKLFPAEQVGGVRLLAALAGPFPDVAFCPTGGVTATGAVDYLAQPNVACVGGSWLAPPALVAARDWEQITQLARAAAALRPPRA